MATSKNEIPDVEMIETENTAEEERETRNEIQIPEVEMRGKQKSEDESVINRNRAVANILSRLLTLRSYDNQEFEIPVSAAIRSVTLKNMVESGLGSGVIPIPIVNGKTLHKIIIFLHVSSIRPFQPIEMKHFYVQFIDKAEMKDLFEMISAAHYLDISSLFTTLRGKIANRMQNKSVEWVRKTFAIDNDFTPEEENSIKQEYQFAWKDFQPDDDS